MSDLLLQIYYDDKKSMLSKQTRVAILDSCFLSPFNPPSGSDSKEPACSEGDPGSIPGLGRSPREGTGNPLQYSCLENPPDGGAWRGYSPWGRKESDTTEQLHFTFPGSSVSKEPACNAGDMSSIPGVGKILQRRKWQPTPVSLPGKSHG